MRLVFGPVLVHRRITLSAFASLCAETEPPGHRVDEPGGQSVDAGIRRLVLSLSVQRITRLEGQVLDFQ